MYLASTIKVSNMTESRIMTKLRMTESKIYFTLFVAPLMSE